MPDGLDELPAFEDIKAYLAERYTSTNAPVEWRGITLMTTVFRPLEADDVCYALVDAGTFAAKTDTASVEGTRRRLLPWIRHELAFGEPAPFGSPTRLETEFVAPELEVWDLDTGATGESLHWLDIRSRARVVVMGSPGVGKTTLLRSLALHELHPGEHDQHARVPLYLMLRDLADADDIIELARRALHSQIGENVEDRFEGLLASGRLLLLLDGLDEVRPALRDKMVAAILSASRRYPRLGLHVSTRQSAYHWRFPGFLHVQVKPFGEKQIYAWCQRRFARIDSTIADRLWRVVLGDHELINLASSPLLLEMLAGVFEKTGSLPRRKADVYSRYLGVLLEDWDKQRGIRRSHDKLLREDKLDALSVAALASWKERRLEFSEEEFAQWIAAVLGEQPVDVIRTVLRDCGLFMASQAQPTPTWRFKHVAFRDYLAAYYLVTRPDDAWGLVDIDQNEPDSLDLWRHACGVTTDASPLLRKIRERESLPHYVRARWLALVLADGVSVSATEAENAVEVVRRELTHALRAARWTLASDGRSWRVSVRSQGVPDAHQEAIIDILHSAIGGGWSVMRQVGSQALFQVAASLFEEAERLLGERWLVRRRLSETGSWEVIGEKRALPTK